MTDHARVPDIDADLLADLGVGIFTVDSSGRVQSTNRRARETFQFSGEPLTREQHHESRFELVDDHERPFDYDDLPVVRALRTGSSVAGVTIGYRERGASAFRWQLFGAHLVPHDDGDVHVLCTFVDITEQRRALEAVSERDHRFRHLAENSADMIFRTRVVPELAFDYVNPAVETMLGYPRDDFYADFDLVHRLVHPEDRDAVWQFFVDTIEGRPTDDHAVVARLNRRDGSLLWVQVRVVPIHDGSEVVALEGIARDVSELKAREADLHHQAMHDALTGIPNRSSFLTVLDRALERARATGSGLAVLYIDLDRFKTVNDGLGHAAGDYVLATLAGRLADVVRPSDNVGRIGGDEFAAVVPGLRGIEESEAVATRLLEALGAPLALDEAELVTTACIGIAYTDDCLQTPAELLRRADVAMYEAKDRGRSRIERYRPPNSSGHGGATAPG